MSSIPLPDGTRLLHIGPHKTGTTALQIALAKHSTELLAQGVRYLSEGPRVNANYAAFALEGRTSRKVEDSLPISLAHWESLKRNAARAQERIVVMSGEEFCVLSKENIAKVVEGFGRERIRILVTLRPLGSILGSQWQQYVQAGKMLKTFEEWLHEVLDSPENPTTLGVSFWLRHRHDKLISRWAEAIGSDKISVIILDDQHHDALPRSFEELVGVRSGTLSLEERTVNRSLTAQETEAIRSFYQLMDLQGYTGIPDHIRYMMSPAEYLKRNRRPLPEEHKILLPSWAAERARKISEEMVGNIKTLNVQIIGNIENLLSTPSHRTESVGSSHSLVPIDLVGWTTLGALVHSRVIEGELPLPKRLSPNQVRRATGGQLVRELVRRMRLRLLGAVDKKPLQVEVEPQWDDE